MTTLRRRATCRAAYAGVLHDSNEWRASVGKPRTDRPSFTRLAAARWRQADLSACLPLLLGQPLTDQPSDHSSLHTSAYDVPRNQFHKCARCTAMRVRQPHFKILRVAHTRCARSRPFREEISDLRPALNPASRGCPIFSEK